MRKLLAGLALAIGVLVVLSPAVSVGGWAVSTLDPMTTPTVGVPSEVGFTIRQHGVTPVDLDDVAIAVTDSSGATTVYPAAPSGEVGHYVASVTFVEGQSTWEIRQGFFEPQALGTITAMSPTEDAVSSPVESATYRWPGAARVLVPIAAIALATIAITDAVVSRRRKTTDAP